MQRNNRFHLRMVGRRSMWAAVVVLALDVAGGHAQSLQHVTYVGGTALAGNDLHGKVLVGTTDALVFEGPSTLTIPYDHVLGYESKAHKKVHVGLLTEGFWRLVAPWPEAKQLSVSYRDAEDHRQVVVLQMSRADEALLVEVLKTRLPPPAARPALSVARPAVIMQEKLAAH